MTIECGRSTTFLKSDCKLGFQLLKSARFLDLVDLVILTGFNMADWD